MDIVTFSGSGNLYISAMPLEIMAIFKDAKFLDIEYVPKEDMFLHRDNERKAMRYVFDNFSTMQCNLFCMGFSGTGKTCMVKYLQEEHLNNKPQSNEKIIYVNVARHDTEMQVMREILFQLGYNLKSNFLNEHYRILKEHKNQYQLKFLLILDEFDRLFEKSKNDNLIYNLLDSGCSMILITNNIIIFDKMEERTKSRLGYSRITFHVYNGLQLFDIIQKRAEFAFTDSVISDKENLTGVLNKISAISAQEHGDARKTLILLKHTAEIAEMNGKTTLNINDVEKAREHSEGRAVMEAIINLPMQLKMVLTAAIDMWVKTQMTELTQYEIYEQYLKICKTKNIRPVTERRMADYLWEIEKTGLIRCKVMPKSRGREKRMNFCTPPQIIQQFVYEEFGSENDRDVGI